jgi:hypothetical protein
VHWVFLYRTSVSGGPKNKERIVGHGMKNLNCRADDVSEE